jgi:predicted nucleic acid-binding protein
VRPLILYLDSSVIGGFYDPEFQEATRKLWRERDEGKFAFRTSPLVAQEIASAPDKVQALLASSFVQGELLPLTTEAEELAAAYLAQKVVPLRFANDARHVALASVHGIGLVVSWNFQHLVNYQREIAFNGVNLLQGYAPIRILSPLELIHGDEIEKEF